MCGVSCKLVETSNLCDKKMIEVLSPFMVTDTLTATSEVGSVSPLSSLIYKTTFSSFTTSFTTEKYYAHIIEFFSNLGVPHQHTLPY